ncbi:MAG: hypothetical protein DRR08_08025 [Candidatus Parabeggiatoa sp. nov. 2]|nr:MAG: hypothetical protein B6247_07540 [Beggiatoa sp. 4572_84]RKZ61702.1 MAG: hypothetical protein DRR08_08025 [Gammaproteobacteria bacterium]
MSYLEQLKNEAQVRQAQDRATELERQQQQAQREELFRTQVKPTLERLRHYLRELAEQLNYLKPDTRITYEIKGYGDIDDFQPQNYRVILLDELNAIREGKLTRHLAQESGFTDTRSNFVLRFRCQTPYKIRFQKRKKREMALQKDYLLKHNIRFSCEEETDANFQLTRAIFVIEPVIYVDFEFVANFKASAIDLTVKNFAKFGKKIYTLAPDEINDPFLDELAKYITRQPNNLVLREKNQSAHRQRKILQSGLQTHPKTLASKPQLSEQQTLHSGSQTQPKTQLSKPQLSEKKPTSTVEDSDEFDEWLRIQEQQLATTPTTTKKGLFRLFGK